MDLVDPSTPLPSWFTEEDLTNYANLYERSGFRTPLQVPYRAWLEDDGVANPRIDVPSMLVMGEKDYVYANLREYLTGGAVKNYVPDLEITFLPEGNHFVQEQFPDKVNQLLVTFLNKHKRPLATPN